MWWDLNPPSTIVCSTALPCSACLRGSSAPRRAAAVTAAPCAPQRLKMATGVLHRVSGGLGRAKSRAQAAGQLVVWSRWGSLRCTGSVVLSVVFVGGCWVWFSVSFWAAGGGDDDLGQASPVTVLASQPVLSGLQLHLTGRRATH